MAKCLDLRAEWLATEGRRSLRVSPPVSPPRSRSYSRDFNRLRRYAYGYTRAWAEAEDIVHDVFLRLWRRRRWLVGVRDLDAYLYRITRNVSLNHIRRHAVEARWRAGEAVQQVAAFNDHAADPPLAEQQITSGERVAAVLQALDTLPPRQREILLLRSPALRAPPMPPRRSRRPVPRCRGTGPAPPSGSAGAGREESGEQEDVVHIRRGEHHDGDAEYPEQVSHRAGK